MTITSDTRRGPYVRVGRHRSTRPRTLHLLDVENLVSGQVCSTAVSDMWAEFVRVVGARWDDQSTVAVSTHNAPAAFFALPMGIRRVVGTNSPDGADLALIDSVDVDWVSEHFGRVVIASGDHIFAPMANQLRGNGVELVQVIGGGLSSAELYRACTAHEYLPKTREAAARGRRSRCTD